MPDFREDTGEILSGRGSFSFLIVFKGVKSLEEKETRIAVIGIIIEDRNCAEPVNALLHQYGNYIIGRMGIPYEKKKVNIISVVLDAPEDAISALSGKIGRLPGVSSKALYSKTGRTGRKLPPVQGERV